MQVNVKPIMLINNTTDIIFRGTAQMLGRESTQ